MRQVVNKYASDTVRALKLNERAVASWLVMRVSNCFDDKAEQYKQATSRAESLEEELNRAASRGK